MSTDVAEDLFFFDGRKSKSKLYRNIKRTRKPTECLPHSLRDVRSSSSLLGRSRLDLFFQKQKLGAQYGSKIKFEQSNDSLIGGIPNNHSKSKDSLPQIKFSEDRLQTVPSNFSDDEFDNRRLYFEEAKFSATTVLSQLGKIFDALNENEKKFNEDPIIQETPVVEISDYTKGCNLIQNKHNLKSNDGIHKNLVNAVGRKLVLPKRIVHLLQQRYADFVSNVLHVKRQWQSESYHDIASFKQTYGIKIKDAGIFSVPSTALGYCYPGQEKNQSETHTDKKKKGRVRLSVSQRSMPLRPKASHDSGVNSDSDGCSAMSGRNSSKQKGLLKSKTRLEKFNLIPENETSHRSSSMRFSTRDAIIPESKAEEGNISSNVQAMINFSISSKVCHEKGWVIDKEATEDPEYHTLVEWAQKRLRAVLDNKKESERQLQEVGLNKERITHYYGDARREMTIKYKKGTKLAKTLQSVTQEERQLFMTGLPDGGLAIYYPCGSPALVTVRSLESKDGYYTLAYNSKAEGGQLVAYFTPTGRGVCYHPNGNLGFISADKYGAFHSEDGVQIQKWKWTPYKLTPPLSFQVNPYITLKCSNKSHIALLIKIQGESTKINVGAVAGAKDLPLEQMGSMMTVEKFSSHTAIELCKTIGKKNQKDDKKRFGRRDKLAEQLLDDALEKKMQDLNLHSSEKKELDLDHSSHHLELKTIHRKFKSAISDIMDYYRQATGLTSPAKLSKIYQRKQNLRSAPPTSTPRTLQREKKKRLKSAPLPRNMKDSFSIFPVESLDFDRPRSCIGDYGKDQLDVRSRVGSPRSPTPLSVSALTLPVTKEPFRCGLFRQPSKQMELPKEGCPVALRNELSGKTDIQCRCDKRHIPYVTDVEFTLFIKLVPKTQLLIISVVESGASSDDPTDVMLDGLYFEQNKNRTFPCVRGRRDPFRLVRYSLSSSYTNSDEIPYLLKRHNVVPGMFMMYQGGKLLFANFIFDGYGNSKKDFLKQVDQTRTDALKGNYLPDDFWFSRNIGEHSPREPWGGDSGKPCNQYEYNVRYRYSLGEDGPPRIETPMTGLSPSFIARCAEVKYISPSISKTSSSSGASSSRADQTAFRLHNNRRRSSQPVEMKEPGKLLEAMRLKMNKSTTILER